MHNSKALVPRHLDLEPKFTCVHTIQPLNIRASTFKSALTSTMEYVRVKTDDVLMS